MKTFSALCTVYLKDGKKRLRIYDDGGLQRELEQYGEGEDLEFTLGPAARKRTARQNSFYHAVVIPLFAEHCGYRPEEMKEALALKLLPVTVRDIHGAETVVPGHTSDLSVEQFNDLIERAQQLGAEMDIFIPDPDPTWKQKGRKVAA